MANTGDEWRGYDLGGDHCPFPSDLLFDNSPFYSLSIGHFSLHGSVHTQTFYQNTLRKNKKRLPFCQHPLVLFLRDAEMWLPRPQLTEDVSRGVDISREVNKLHIKLLLLVFITTMCVYWPRTDIIQSATLICVNRKTLLVVWCCRQLGPLSELYMYQAPETAVCGH